MCRDINSTTNNFFAVNTQGVDGSTTWEVQTITNNHTVGMQGNEVLVSLEYAAPYSYIAFKVRASNSCGFSNWLEYYIDVINNCGSENYQSYMVSPNPSSESVTIEKKSRNSTSTNSNNNIEYKLYDFNYNLIYEGSLVNDKATVNVSNFKKSIYILKIYGTKEEETHQIIVK